MKKLLSAIWAKALSFLLTPLAGVAAVNGVSELIMVYFYDVWNPHPVRLWVVTVLCAVVAVGSLLFSLSAAGHWPGHEGVHLTWLDRIPLDVFVLALAGEWLIYENASYYPSSVLGEVVFVALAYLFILAFTARCKAGMVLADLVVLRLLRLLSQVCGEYQQRLEKQVLEPVLSLCEPGAAAMADGRLLWRVLDNLMSNICKYAMPGTRVYLSTEAGEDGVRMVVKNISRYPLNISADELTERFVRGDSSRSTEGSGLGLSIATSLMSLQGGGFRLTIDGDLFKVTLTLPAAGAEE